MNAEPSQLTQLTEKMCLDKGSNKAQETQCNVMEESEIYLS